VTNRSFPHQRHKPRTPRPTTTESPDTVMLTVNKARSFPTVQTLSKVQTLSEMQNPCGVRGKTELRERMSTTNKNENPEKGRPTGLRRGGKVA